MDDEVKPQIIEKQIKVKDLMPGDQFKHYWHGKYIGTFFALSRKKWDYGKPFLEVVCKINGYGCSEGQVYHHSDEEHEVTLIEEIWEGLQKI